MHRFYLPDVRQGTRLLTLTDSEAAHAVKVLRVQPGDTVSVLDGQGTSAITRVLETSRTRVTLEVQSLEQAARIGFECTLFQAVTKLKSMDWIVEKATELGIHRVQPVLSERVISKFDMAGEKKAVKWHRTAIEALKQCGNPWLPILEPALPLATALHKFPDIPLHLMGSLSPEASELRQVLQSKPLFNNASPSPQVGIWIGPEGDFSPAEAARLRAAGVIPITLGRNTLRSETAAVCALALVCYELRLLKAITDNSPALDTRQQ
ncbi:MAG: 16S rRNA (uracil(1498)-N(3))-methyltransferase [Verrucomicrobia bacterium]|nr:16S rRNA (uracil(1498)-N(3))-methyltransferase [Verrucomicrobiota bacterium]